MKIINKDGREGVASMRCNWRNTWMSGSKLPNAARLVVVRELTHMSEGSMEVEGPDRLA